MDQAAASVASIVQSGGNLPVPLSTLLGGIVVSLSLLRTVLPAVDEGLALVPHHTVFSPVPTWPVPFLWNVVTAHFFEAHWLKAVLVTPWLVILAQMLERLWTVRALAMHLGFTAFCSGSAVFLAELVHVYRTHHERDFFIPIRGCAGLLVALSVALRHAYPLEAVPFTPRSWGFQCQHLPFAIAVLVSVVGLLAPKDTMLEWPFAPLGLFFGWLHLRYVMWFPYAGAHGDHSQDFCFSALFPRPLRPLVGCCSSVVYAIGVLVIPSYVQLRQVEGESGHPIVYDPRQAVELATMPNGAGAGLGPRPPGPALDPAAAAGAPGSQEYNARRAKALQLLDDNINSLLAPGSGRPMSLGKKSGSSTGSPSPKEDLPEATP